MKLSSRLAIALPALLFTLSASGHDTAGIIPDHGIGYFLPLAALTVGIAAILRR